MSCPSFDVTVKDVKAALAKARKAATDAHGTFSGYDTKGTYKISDDGWISGKYTIAGSYTVEGKTITITNTITADKPTVVTCDRVADKIRDWLK